MERPPRRTTLARQLRRRQTHAERVLWYHLGRRRPEGAKFRRQHPIGPYIVDFVNLEARLVIEVDGGQHNKSMVAADDQVRGGWLRERGYTVLRFWDHDVLRNVEGVLEQIRLALKGQASPSP